MKKITVVFPKSADNKAFYTPCWCVALYLLGVLLLYQFGPIAWPTHKPILFYALQLLYISFFAWGYHAGTRSKLPPARKWGKNREQKLLQALPFWTMLAIMFHFFNMVRAYGIKDFNIFRVLNRITSGLSNLGASYSDVVRLNQTLVSNDVYGGKIFTLVNFIWMFADMNIVFLAILYFSSQSKTQKILSAALVFEIALYYVSVGTNIGVFRLIMPIFIFLFISSQSQDMKTGIRLKAKGKNTRKVLMVGGVLFIAFLIYFVTMLKSRGGILNWDKSFFTVGGVGLNYDSIMFKILPAFLFIPLISIASYTTQGLYAFSLSLEVSWIPMFGLGGSMWLINLLGKHGVDINQFTYQNRIMERFGWDDRVQWACMYTWAANDLSLYGVILWMFLIGYVFALAYRDSLTTGNPFAKLLVAYFAIMCIFIPGNNQIFQTTATHFPFITAFIAWLVTTRVRVRF